MMKCTLADIVKFFNGKVRPKEEGLIPVYGGNGVLGYCSNSNYSGETIIIGRVGAYCGATYFEQQPIWVSDNALAAKQRTNYHIKYLYYLIKNLNLNKYAQGSSHPLLTQRLLNSIEINVHESICDQNKIANLLSTLDDKIELNKKINQTLESIAQTIFKSWFVDFDPVHAKANVQSEDEYDAIAKELGISREILDLFPSEFEESELGLIPKGWKINKFGEVVNVFDYVANGSFAALKKNVTTYDNPNYALYVRTTDYNNKFSNNLKYVDKNSYEFLKKSKLLGFETIISNVGDVGTVFRPPVWFDLPMTLGSNAVGLTSIIETPQLDSYLYYFLKSPQGQMCIDQITTGNAQLKFNKTNFRQLIFLLPAKEILSQFYLIEHYNYQKIVKNNKETYLLEKIKHLMLPKLLSGEIDVSNLDLEPEND
ncbi:TPA: hypothetical protein JBD11_02510 [Legionella pneumophila subsp. pneumophila]|nr:hypothetical protein [Legionella pneumophila subsp. pneumophila]